jgi:hypothetical protein
MQQVQVRIDFAQAGRVAQLLGSLKVPREQEASEHRFSWAGTTDQLANAYYAIVGICHQTSPIGERRLQGTVEGVTRFGWDYLKERFLIAASQDLRMAAPEYWQAMRPQDLGALYEDERCGITLNRVNERAFLLNDMGRHLHADGLRWLREAFDAAGRSIGGESGFLRYVSASHAYADPLHKKGFLYLSLAVNECGWSPGDPENLLSPVDYHELRGHLRVGTVVPVGKELSRRVQLGLPVADPDDYPLRKAAQEANNWIARAAHLTNSALHYLLWNVFRNCCARVSGDAHCWRCPADCRLPLRYRGMGNGSSHCILAGVCRSASRPVKVAEPPYVGHYY